MLRNNEVYYDNTREDNLKMMRAATSYNLDLIKELVRNGLDIHCENDFVFEISLGHNKPEITSYVISLVNGNNKDHYINKALVEYAHAGDIQFVKEMIELGGNIHYMNDEAVNWACGFGQLDMVKFLVGLGANIEVETAKSRAKQNNHQHIIDYLT
jgi:ankyrin repeat protein